MSRDNFSFALGGVRASIVATQCLWSVSSRRYAEKALSFGLNRWFSEVSCFFVGGDLKYVQYPIWRA
jgi:hypothetical protein